MVLSDEEAGAIGRSRAVHVCAIVCAIVFTITTRAGSIPLVVFGPTSAFFIGGVSEGFTRGATQALVNTTKTFGSCLLGAILWFGTFFMFAA